MECRGYVSDRLECYTDVRQLSCTAFVQSGDGITRDESNKSYDSDNQSAYVFPCVGQREDEWSGLKSENT
jgi:hypothetical protein